MNLISLIKKVSLIKKINYKEEHYIEGLSIALKNKEQDEIKELAKNNLNLLNQLCEVKK